MIKFQFQTSHHLPLSIRDHAKKLLGVIHKNREPVQFILVIFDAMVRRNKVVPQHVYVQGTSTGKLRDAFSGRDRRQIF